MLVVYSALFAFIAVLILFSDCRAKKIMGYCMLSYSVNLFMLGCNPISTNLTQGLILTSIVISLGFAVIMVHRR